MLGISLEIPSISNLRYEKPSISKFLIRNTWYFDRNPSFLIEMLHIFIEIQRISFETLGISTICHNHIPYHSPNKKDLISWSSAEYVRSYFVILDPTPPCSCTYTFSLHPLLFKRTYGYYFLKKIWQRYIL